MLRVIFHELERREEMPPQMAHLCLPVLDWLVLVAREVPCGSNALPLLLRGVARLCSRPQKVAPTLRWSLLLSSLPPTQGVACLWVVLSREPYHRRRVRKEE